jgi:hypothetical protein
MSDHDNIISLASIRAHRQSTVFNHLNDVMVAKAPVSNLALLKEGWIREWLQRSLADLSSPEDQQYLHESLLLKLLLQNESTLTDLLYASKFFTALCPIQRLIVLEGELQQDDITPYPVPIIVFQHGNGLSLSCQYYQFDKVLMVTDESIMSCKTSVPYHITLTQKGQDKVHLWPVELAQTLLTAYRLSSLLFMRGCDLKETDDKYIFNYSCPSSETAATNWTLSFDKSFYHLQEISI